MLLWPAFTYTERWESVHVGDPVTTVNRAYESYRFPSTAGQTMLDQPPTYSAEGETWTEMESPIS